MPGIQEAKCFEFTVQILPPPWEFLVGREIFWRVAQISPPPPSRFISVNALGLCHLCNMGNWQLRLKSLSREGHILV